MTTCAHRINLSCYGHISDKRQNDYDNKQTIVINNVCTNQTLKSKGLLSLGNCGTKQICLLSTLIGSMRTLVWRHSASADNRVFKRNISRLWKMRRMLSARQYCSICQLSVDLLSSNFKQYKYCLHANCVTAATVLYIAPVMSNHAFLEN